MSFLINCDNRGCMKTQSPLLDLTTNTVVCAECHLVITNVTQFAKSQLKAMGQTTKRHKAQRSYAIKCSHCNVEELPTLVGEQFVCASCKQELTNISAPFKLILKDHIKNGHK